MTDRQVMALIKSKDDDCLFTQADLINWVIELEGISRNTAYKRVLRIIKRLPVELLGGKFYRLLITPSDEFEPVKKEKGAKKEKDRVNVSELAKEILEYLNQKTGKRYKGKPADLLKIKARLAPPESHTLEDFKTVIDKKVAEWKGTDWEKFLRPETLFGTKFESYLNQSGSSKQQGKAEQMAAYDFTKYVRGE